MYGASMTPEQRVEAFRRMVEQRPDEPFARYSLAMSLRAAGRGEDAAREFEELARRKPAYVPTYLMLGQVLEALGRAADAAAAYERGVDAAARANDQHARSELEQALGVLRAQGAR
jgi:predicted Zn-dependent protease